MSSTPPDVVAADAASTITSSPDMVARVAHEFTEALRSEGNIRVVFGAPLTLDKHKIIPVARVEIGFGGAMASSNGRNRIAERMSSLAHWLTRGFGAGGGGGIKVTPMGFIHEDGDHVQYQAITDGVSDRSGEDRRSRSHRM